MLKHDFLNIMQLTDADARVVDPDILGIALVVVHRSRTGELQLQIGSNVPEEALIEALFDMRQDKRKTRHG